jgi:MarR family transcriptional regulator for hemolysin
MQRDELVEQFFNVSQTMQQAWRMHFFRLLSDEHVSPAQMGLLFTIQHKQPVSGRDLALAMHITRSAVTQLTDALEQLGYIERREDAHDRRVSYITLSARGMAKYQALESIRKELYVRLAGALSDDELRITIAIHTKMIAVLETANDE